MSTDQNNVPKLDETTPLLPNGGEQQPAKYGKSVLYRALLCGFIVTVSFGVTQVPLIYVFRVMTCEEYYKTPHEPVSGTDRCANRDIEAATSRAVAILAASTTMFGVLNLFVTNWMIKKFGIKAALLNSVFWPATRLLVQNIGVMIGAGQGIVIIQASQIITVVGGPAGYLLALNSYVAEIIEPSERTGALGKLQGCSFLGMSASFLAGGLISDLFGIIAPFRVTLILFLTSCLYVALALPWIPQTTAVETKASTGIAKFFGPLKIFTPQKWVHSNGLVKMEYGTILLGAGVFIGVLATGFIPVLLQMYATNVFGFGTTENGYLISLNSFIRGIFLTTLFPRIISAGRRWFSRNTNAKDAERGVSRGSAIPELPREASDFAAVDAIGFEEEPTEPVKLAEEKETFDFDLAYTRYSLLADAIFTGAASFVNQGWEMYLISVLLPFASGTGAAAKGTILQMCSPAERADALSAITLVEMIGNLLTITVFGLVYAAFANLGKTYLVFICNAAVALLGFLILQFSRFPPKGSKRFEIEEVEAEPENVQS